MERVKHSDRKDFPACCRSTWRSGVGGTVLYSGEGWELSCHVSIALRRRLKEGATRDRHVQAHRPFVSPTPINLRPRRLPCPPYQIKHGLFCLFDEQTSYLRACRPSTQRPSATFSPPIPSLDAYPFCGSRGWLGRDHGARMHPLESSAADVVQT